MSDASPDIPLQYFLIQQTTADADLTKLLEYTQSHTKEALVAQLQLAVATKKIVLPEEDDPLARQLMSTQLRCMRLALRQRDAQ
jgi:hypothetical protein